MEGLEEPSSIRNKEEKRVGVPVVPAYPCKGVLGSRVQTAVRISRRHA